MLGFSGESIISTSRLIDSPILKAAMAGTGADLGIIVSEVVYKKAIRRMLGFPATEYMPVKVANRESQGQAWLRLAQQSSSTHGTSRDNESSTAGTSGKRNLHMEKAEVLDSDELLKAEWSTVNDGIQAIYKVLGPPPLKTLTREAK